MELILGERIMLDIKKCKRCKFYTVRMVNETCYYYEITGKRPTILSPEECFESRIKIKF